MDPYNSLRRSLSGGSDRLAGGRRDHAGAKVATAQVRHDLWDRGDGVRRVVMQEDDLTVGQPPRGADDRRDRRAVVVPRADVPEHLRETVLPLDRTQSRVRVAERWPEELGRGTGPLAQDL